MTHDPESGTQDDGSPEPARSTAGQDGGTIIIDERERMLRSGDLVISPIMMLLSLFFAIQSFAMILETVSSGMATVATSPGLLPAVICTLIFLCSTWVYLNALRSRVGYWFLRPEVIRTHLAQWDAWQPLVVVGLFVVYVFVLIGWLPFLVASALFGISMMAIFKAAKPWVIVAIVVPYVTFVGFAFTQYAATRFPNDPIINWLVNLAS